MGRTALMVVIALSLTTGYTFRNIGQRMVDAEKLLVSYYSTQVAQNVARSAVHATLSRLCLQPSLRGTFADTDRYLVGTVDTVWISGENSTTNPTVIRVTAYYLEQRYDIRVRAQLYSNSLPTMFQYAILSDGNLDINGNVRVQDDNNPNLNADVHTNGNLEIIGNTNSVTGFGTAVGNISSHPPGALNTTFVPNVNPLGLPGYGPGPLVEVPVVRCDPYINATPPVHNRTTTGNLTLTGNITLGTKENPVIWYVSGNLSIQGNVSGYGAFLVRGNVEVNGNVSIATPDPEGRSTVGIYTEGNVDIAGNVTAQAQILAAGNVIMSGGSKLYGSAIATGNIKYNGTVDIYYRPANMQLTSPLWPGSLRASIISWYE